MESSSEPSASKEGTRIQLRKADVLWELKDVKFKTAEPLDFTKPQQLPSFRHLIERFLTIQQDKKTNFKNACQELALEFEYDWVYMNVYTISKNAIFQKFQRFLDDVSKLKRCAVTKRGNAWNEKADDLISILDNGVDIKTDDPDTIQSREEEYEVCEGYMRCVRDV